LPLKSLSTTLSIKNLRISDCGFLERRAKSKSEEQKAVGRKQMAGGRRTWEELRAKGKKPEEFRIAEC